MATLTDAFISLNDIINNFIISYTGPSKLIPDAKRTEVVFHARRCLQEFSYETLKSQMVTTGTTTAYVATPTVVLPFFAIPSDAISTIEIKRASLNNSAALPGVLVTSASGNFSCTATTEITVGGTITISGIDTGTATIGGYVNPGPKTYYIIATNGTSTFQLSETLGGVGLTTSGSTTTGLAFQLNNVPVLMTQTSTASPANNTSYYIDYAGKKIIFNSAVSQINISYDYLSNALTTDETAAIPKLAEEALYSCMVYAILANREGTDGNLLQRLLIEKIDRLERSKSRLIFTNFS